MNRTQHLTSSQPRPKRRMARPGACPLGVVARNASAANDHYMGPFDGGPVKPGASRIEALAGTAGGTAGSAIQLVEAGVDFINLFAAKTDPAWWLPRRTVVDNGAELHSTEAVDLHAVLPPPANAANKSTRGAA